jgi:hypothetical protein
MSLPAARIHISVTPQAHFRTTIMRSVLMATGILGAVAISPMLVKVVSPTKPQWRIMGSGVAFLLLASVCLAKRQDGSFSLRRNLRQTSLNVSGAFGFVVIGCVMLNIPSTHYPLTVLTVFVSAAVEEFVFRRRLPNRLQDLFQSSVVEKRISQFTAQVFAQCLFVIAHLVIRTDLLSSRGAYEMGRLFVGGLLYANLITRGGLWLGAGTHCLLNLHLQFSAQIASTKISLLALFIGASISLAALYTVPISGESASNN